ncbi:hypothetical protein D3C81_1321330 [compost metagenome]
MPADVPGQRQRHAIGDNRCDQADARQAHFRQTEHAGDQRVIEQEIRHRAGQADDHHRCRPADCTGETAQGHETEVAGQGEGQGNQELPGRVDVGFGLAEQQQHRFQVPQQQPGAQRHQPRQPQSGLGQTRSANDVAGALANRHQCADRCNHADAENRHERISRRTETAARERFRTQARHHQRVSQHHQHVRQL